MAQHWPLKPVVAALDAIVPLNKVPLWRMVLPAALGWIKGKPRYFPKVKWLKNDFTHDIFRAFELVFGREYGVVRYTSGEVYEDAASPTGFYVRNKKFYSFEAWLADKEGNFRYDLNTVKERMLESELVKHPQLAFAFAALFVVLSKATLGGLPLAIGAVTRALYDDGSILTFNAGSTGNVLIGMMGDHAGTSYVPTYGGVNMSYLASPITRCWGAGGSGVYNVQLTNPPGGSNTLTLGCSYFVFAGVDSTNSTSGVNAATQAPCGSVTTIGITTTRGGCWLAASANGSGTPNISTAGVINESLYSSAGNTYIADSSSTIGAAQTVNTSIGGANNPCGVCVAAAQPPFVAPVGGGFFSMMLAS